jgi:hypothetical protein
MDLKKINETVQPYYMIRCNKRHFNRALPGKRKRGSTKKEWEDIELKWTETYLEMNPRPSPYYASLLH